MTNFHDTPSTGLIAFLAIALWSVDTWLKARDGRVIRFGVWASAVCLLAGFVIAAIKCAAFDNSLLPATLLIGASVICWGRPRSIHLAVRIVVPIMLAAAGEVFSMFTTAMVPRSDHSLWYMNGIVGTGLTALLAMSIPFDILRPQQLPSGVLPQDVE